MSGIRFKVGVLAAGGVAVILLVSLAQEMNRRWQVQREVQTLEAEVRAAERKAIELENLNQYFRTDAFQERLARENLNYSAPGEKVVLIPEEAQQAAVASNSLEKKPELLSPPMKWWNIFFVSESPFATLGHDT